MDGCEEGKGALVLKSWTKADWLLVFIIGLLPLLNLWQSLDFTDTGYYLSIYQFIFSHPDRLLYAFPTWLTNVAGGLWLTLFPAGMLSIRILDAVCIWAVFIGYYRLLREWLPRTWLLASLLVSMLLAKSFINAMGYNTLTALLYAAALLALKCGARKKTSGWLLACGGFLGLNVFARLPNAVALLFLAAPALQARLYGENWETGIRRSMIAGAGALTSIGAVVAVMAALGHLEFYIRSLQWFRAIAADGTGSGHGGSDMIKSFMLQTIYGGKYVAAMLVGMAALTVVLLFIQKYRGSRFAVHILEAVSLVCGIGIVAVGVLVDAPHLRMIHFVAMEFIPCLLDLILLVGIWRMRKEKQELRFWYGAAILLMALTPFGSAVAVSNSGYGMWLAIPLAVSELRQWRSGFSIEETSQAKRGLSWGIRALTLLLPICICSYSVTQSLVHVYADSKNRMRLNQPLAAPQLIGVFTTPERARIVDELSLGLKRLPPDVDSIIYFGGCATMLYYLADLPPAIPAFWPEVGEYRATEFAADLANARTARAAVIEVHFDANDNEWPNASLEWNGADCEGYRQKEATLKQYLAERQYRLVWQNEYFSLYCPADNK